MTVSLQQTPPDCVLEMMMLRSDSFSLKMYIANGLSLNTGSESDGRGSEIFRNLLRVDEFDGIEGVLNVHDGQKRAEDFILHDRVGRLDVDQNGGLDESLVRVDFSTDGDGSTLHEVDDSPDEGEKFETSATFKKFN